MGDGALAQAAQRGCGVSLRDIPNLTGRGPWGKHLQAALLEQSCQARRPPVVPSNLKNSEILPLFKLSFVTI